MLTVVSFQVADGIELKNVKANFSGELLFSDSDELFYRTGELKYTSFYRYGGVSLMGYDKNEREAFLRWIVLYCRNPFPEPFSDEYLVEINATEKKVSHNRVAIIDEDPQALRMIMLTLAQSVALDFYSRQAFALLEDTNGYTQLLERKGRLSISRLALKKYIGKTLLLKNRVSQHLYIFDSPPETWENERLDRLHMELKRNFDLTERFRGVADSLEIVKENLELFRDLLQHRTAVFLEWIIIILIAVEVVHFIFDKIIS